MRPLTRVGAGRSGGAGHGEDPGKRTRYRPEGEAVLRDSLARFGPRASKVAHALLRVSPRDSKRLLPGLGG